MATSYPFNRRAAAQAKEAGPEPMQAVFPLDGAGSSAFSGRNIFVVSKGIFLFSGLFMAGGPLSCRGIFWNIVRIYCRLYKKRREKESIEKSGRKGFFSFHLYDRVRKICFLRRMLHERHYFGRLIGNASVSGDGRFVKADDSRL